MSGAVVCDLDGTLVDSAPGLRFALNQLRGEEGRRTLVLGEVIPMIGDGATQLVHRAFAATGAIGPWVSIPHAVLLRHVLNAMMRRPGADRGENHRAGRSMHHRP